MAIPLERNPLPSDIQANGRGHGTYEKDSSRNGTTAEMSATSQKKTPAIRGAGDRGLRRSLPANSEAEVTGVGSGCQEKTVEYFACSMPIIGNRAALKVNALWLALGSTHYLRTPFFFNDQ
jgi:hypothetical protein